MCDKNSSKEILLCWSYRQNVAEVHTVCLRNFDEQQLTLK